MPSTRYAPTQTQNYSPYTDLSADDMIQIWDSSRGEMRWTTLAQLDTALPFDDENAVDVICVAGADVAIANGTYRVSDVYRNRKRYENENGSGGFIEWAGAYWAITIGGTLSYSLPVETDLNEADAQWELVDGSGTTTAPTSNPNACSS